MRPLWWLGCPQEKLENVAGNRDVWANVLNLLPPQPDFGKAVENGWMGDLIREHSDHRMSKHYKLTSHLTPDFSTSVFQFNPYCSSSCIKRNLPLHRDCVAVLFLATQYSCGEAWCMQSWDHDCSSAEELCSVICLWMALCCRLLLCVVDEEKKARGGRRGKRRRGRGRPQWWQSEIGLRWNALWAISKGARSGTCHTPAWQHRSFFFFFYRHVFTCEFVRL